MSIHTGIQERLGRVAKFSAFYLVGFVKEFYYFAIGIMRSRNFIRMSFLILEGVLRNVANKHKKMCS